MWTHFAAPVCFTTAIHLGCLLAHGDERRAPVGSRRRMTYVRDRGLEATKKPLNYHHPRACSDCGCERVTNLYYAHLYEYCPHDHDHPHRLPPLAFRRARRQVRTPPCTSIGPALGPTHRHTGRVRQATEHDARRGTRVPGKHCRLCRRSRPGAPECTQVSILSHLPRTPTLVPGDSLPGFQAVLRRRSAGTWTTPVADAPPPQQGSTSGSGHPETTARRECGRRDGPQQKTRYRSTSPARNAAGVHDTRPTARRKDPHPIAPRCGLSNTAQRSS